MHKDIEYAELVLSVKQYYEQKPHELRNIRNGDTLFDLVWCNELVDEINLWTYWQGAGVETPEVMIVGQDFGNCNDPFFEKCVRSKAKDRKNISEEYVHFIRSNKNNKTDNMLLELTEKGLGEQYSASAPSNKNLFMTNLCLGYRSVDRVSGGNLNAYLKHDSCYISKLIKIKKPKVVICLGMDTYFNLASAFNVDKEALKDIAGGFWNLLDKGENYQQIQQGDSDFRIYGVSHTGSNGSKNRKKNSKWKGTEKLSGKSLMMEDWKRIGEYLGEIKRI